MRVLFWLSFAAVGYAYVGYALLLALYAKGFPKPHRTGPCTPTVSIVMAAHNEEPRLAAKLENLARLAYPVERMEIVVASDGSTDGTVAILREREAWAGGMPLRAVVLERAMGKAAALNQAVRAARGEVLVFLDVRQRVDADAVAQMVRSFADPAVGAVSGELLLEAGDGAGDALGIYWKIEKMVRKLESRTGSVVGVTGAIYAMRRELYADLPVGTILDDVLVPMNVVRQGRRVVFEPLAIARDRIFAEPGKEFGRKVRTLTGNYQLVQLAPWLLSPRNPLLFRLISHKLLRLLVPFLLVAMLVSAALAGGWFFRAVFGMQLIFYVLAVCGGLSAATRRFRPVAIAHTFAMLNVAAALALPRFVAGRKVWV